MTRDAFVRLLETNRVDRPLKTEFWCVAKVQQLGMSEALESLTRLLDLEYIDVDLYRGQHPENSRSRTYGGQVIAQALMAAGRTVDRGRVHSLHSYFLRPGDPTVPILFKVDRIRDGRSFTTRRVVALQRSEAIYSLQASFHVDEASIEHQIDMPEVPEPETIEPIAPFVDNENASDFLLRRRPIDMRYIGEPPHISGEPREPRRQLWMRANGTLPEDPLLHACIVAYASDMGLVEVMIRPHSGTWFDGSFMVASLDHCMWFHREVRADEWLLYDAESPAAFGGRGLARGFIFSHDGELKISVVQEGLTRMTIKPTT